MASVNSGPDATPDGSTIPNLVTTWSQAVAVRSFTASTIPVTAGSLLALIDRRFSLILFVLMLLASVACHAGANLANDYFDYKKGIDSPRAPKASKMIVDGRLSASDVRWGMIVAFSLATAMGLIIVAETSWRILALALASIAAAYFYTGGPKPLGYMALGEVIAFVFMGPIMVGGAYFAMAERITTPVLLVSCAIGSLVAAIMHANNIRDIESDRAAGKTTLAQRSGRALANQEYLLLISGGFLLIIVLVALRREYWPLLLTVAALPVASRLISTMRSAAGQQELNAMLRKTAGLHLRFGSLLILGLLLRALLDHR